MPLLFIAVAFFYGDFIMDQEREMGELYEKHIKET